MMSARTAAGPTSLLTRRLLIHRRLLVVLTRCLRPARALLFLLLPSLPSPAFLAPDMYPARHSTDPDDPLSRAIAPPPGESSQERAARLHREDEAKRVNDEIDERLKQERAAWKKNKAMFKLLLLGQSESGKCPPSNPTRSLPDPGQQFPPASTSSVRCTIPIEITLSYK